MSASGHSTCFQVLQPNPYDSLDNLFVFEWHKLGWLCSGLFMLLATTLSLGLILEHARNYTRPSQQRYIIRILFLVPIYTITGWLSYVFYRSSPYFEMSRGLYEALVISSFFLLLVNYMGQRPEEQRRAMQRKQRGPKKLFPPCCCIVVPRNSRHFLQFIKFGILQFVLLKPLLSAASMVLFRFNLYCPENMDLATNAKPYIVAINVLSILTAMYSMRLFYSTMSGELQEHQPFLKFISVKLVVFFSIIQTWILEIIDQLHYIHSTKHWTVSNINTGIISLLINFEMIFFALLHYRAFPYRPYLLPGKIPFNPAHVGLLDALNVLDLLREVAHGIEYFINVIFLGNSEWGTDQPPPPLPICTTLEPAAAIATTDIVNLSTNELDVRQGVNGRFAYTSLIQASLTEFRKPTPPPLTGEASNARILEEANTRIIRPNLAHLSLPKSNPPPRNENS